jgi:hypothetical protein
MNVLHSGNCNTDSLQWILGVSTRT